MKRINKFFNPRLPVAILLSTVVLASCTEKFDEINTDRNAIATVGASELPFLFAKAEQTAIPNIWNYQVAQNLFADQYAQYFACTATYFPSDRLNIRMDWVGAAFNPIYTDLVPQLQSIFQAAESPNTPEYALAQVVWVLGFHRVTDYWGPIPYFNAGLPGRSVAYDGQDKIYDDFFSKLDSAANVLKANPDAVPFGSFDLIYGGDVTKWLHFTNSLRLRLALRISNANPGKAKDEAEKAVADGVMENSPSEDAYIKKSLSGSDYNGLSIMSDWNEFRMSAAMESVMNGYNDPRESVYWLPAGADASNPAGTGKYEGLRNGLTSTQLTETINGATANSKVGKRWSSPPFAGNSDYLTTPLNVMSVAESWFNRAEGKLLGWNMGGDNDAQKFYERGITESMHQWGITDAAAITAYINSAATPVAPNDYLNSPAVSTAPVKYNAARAKEQIGIQKWLAMFPDGNEAWADYRRGRNFILYPVANSENADIPDPTVKWIRRIPFLLSETQNNADGVKTGYDLIGGQANDKITTPLWWDKN